MTLVEACVISAMAALVAGSVMALSLPFGRWTWPVAAVSSAVCLVATIIMTVDVSRNGPVLAFGSWVYVDALGVIVADLVAGVGLLAVLNSRPYIEREIEHGELDPARARHYYALVLAFLATMFAVPVLNNLGAMWVAIEATTVASALLVSIHRDKAGLEAAWKYLIIGSVGIAFAVRHDDDLLCGRAHPGDSQKALNWTTLHGLPIS
jgi:hydrogenase-4 component F